MRTAASAAFIFGALLLGQTALAATALAPGDTLSSVILNANFDADTPGLPPDATLPAPPPGDYLTLDTSGGSILVDSSVDGLSYPVVLRQDNITSQVGLSAWGAAAPADVEKVFVRWRAVAHDDNPDDIMVSAVRSASGALIASVTYNPHGVLTYNGPAGAGSTIPVSYSNNKNNQFTVSIDFLAHTTSLSVDGVAMAGLQGVPFLEPAGDFARIAYSLAANHPQSFAIDDISAVAFSRIPDHAPVVTAPASVSGAEGTALSFSVSASDPDGEAIASLTAAPLPAGATFTADAGNTSGTLAWTPGFGQAGSYTVTFTASNALSGSAATVVAIANTDRAPVVTAPPVVDGEIGGTLIFTVTAADPDGDSIGSLTADLSLLPAGNDATFVPDASNTSGVLTWHMQAGEGGSFPVTFTAMNALSGTAFTRINVSAPGTSITGELVWTPHAGEEGEYDVVFTVFDEFGQSASSTTHITITTGASGAATLAPTTRDVSAPLAPASPQKGPIISSPSSATGGTDKTLTVSATGTSGSGTLASRFTVTRQSGTVSASAQAPGSATQAASLTMTADITALPQGNNAVFTVDRDPVVTAPVLAFGDAQVPMSFTVSATDPDLDAILSFAPDFTGLPSGNNASLTTDASNTSGTFSWTPALGDSGNFTVGFVAANALVGRANTTIQVRGVAAATAYSVSKKIQLSSNKPTVSFVLQPVGGSFTLTSIVMSTVALVSPGTGSVSRIYAAPKSAVIGDRNGDQIQDLTIAFLKSDLRLLFSLLHGSVVVPVTLEGQLLDGRRFLASFSVTVVAGGGTAQASVVPNPLNPQARLTFITQKPGPLQVRLFDLNGRLVRELLEERLALPGEHAVTVDGRDRFGRPLASGVYYYRIEAPEGITQGKLAVVK